MEALIAIFVLILSIILWYFFALIFLRINLPTSRVVSNTKCISLFYFCGIPTVKIDSFNVTLRLLREGDDSQQDQTIETNCVIRDGQFKIFFSAKVAGLYRLLLEQCYHVMEYRFFLSNLEADPGNIHLEDERTYFVQENKAICLKLILKDIYGNNVSPRKENVLPFNVESPLNFHVVFIEKNIFALASTREEGSIRVRITYGGIPIKTASAGLIYVSKAQLNRINAFSNGKEIESRLCVGNYVKGTLIQREKKALNKSVYLYIRSCGLIVKEYVMGFIPRLIYMFPISHKYTKLEMDNHSKTVRVTDVFMNKVFVFMVSDASFLAGVFVRVADIKSPTNFDEKVMEFFAHFGFMGELTFLTNSSLLVDRHCLLYTTMNGLQSRRWNGPLKISFNNELGIDDGGLRKEWYTLLWKELTESKAFIHNERGTYAPNPVWKDTSIFEFAGKILGKALKLGTNPKFRLHMPFSLSSSFLSLLKGMNVGYRHFEVDYPDFYSRQIKYIAENQVEELDLTFVDEIYDDQDGSLIESKVLKPSGDKLKVTDANKFEYLNLLASWRLSERIKEATAKFKAGFNTYISEDLIFNFDESELDLLISGYSTIDFNDLRKHVHSDCVSHTVMEWFWMVLQNLSEEQKILFLKFVTGSSRLPANGFRGLTPPFTINEISEEGKLPSSHVCVNVLNLHPHASFEAFESSFITAITEGHSGFQNY